MHTLVGQSGLWGLLMAQGNFGGGFGPQQNPPNPYANMGTYGQAPPPKKSNALFWILGIVGGIGILAGVCCCGGGYFAFSTGMNMMAEQTKAEVQGHPVIQEHIGTIETATSDFAAAITESQKKGDTGGESHMIIHVKGSKGTGDIIGKMPQGGGQRLTEKILRLPDGRELPLD